MCYRLLRYFSLALSKKITTFCNATSSDLVNLLPPLQDKKRTYILKTGAGDSFEMLLPIYQPAHSYNQGNHNLNIHRRDNLKTFLRNPYKL